MSDMSGIEKLRVLLPHWLEHNDAHIAEFKKWRGVAREEVDQDVAKLLSEAIQGMEKTGESLAKALDKIGGPKGGHHGHHHHH